MLKSSKKIDEKGEARKMTKNDHQGGPRIAKNAKKSTLENLKNQKNGPQKSFFERLIFQQFLGCKKIGKKGGQGCQKGL